MGNVEKLELRADNISMGLKCHTVASDCHMCEPIIQKNTLIAYVAIETEMPFWKIAGVF